jgi:hypothetical protein
MTCAGRLHILRRQRVDQLSIMARGEWKTDAMFKRYSITDEQDQLDAQAAMDRAMAAPSWHRVERLRAVGDNSGTMAASAEAGGQKA